MSPRSQSPEVTPFERLPFEAQKAFIREEVEAGRGNFMLQRCAELSDVQPLVETLRNLERVGGLENVDWTHAVVALPDAALATVFGSNLAPRILLDLAVDALRSWSPSRASGIAFLCRWVRRHASDDWARLVADAREHTRHPPAADSGRWLLYLDGQRLHKLASDASWSECVHQTVEQVVASLSNAPKSISQANAEALLARRVYADPGHFFFELLQNADDAGATSWTVNLDPEGITVQHDGVPFGFLDLVGVLSIGQTTKTAEQIGFFGVGFKSVYEVCDRPRITSGVFDVEIAQVSIPRLLCTPSATSRTRLHLPIESGRDVQALEAQALRIPPETLLTLPCVRAYRIEGPSGTTSWTLERKGELHELRGAGMTRRYRLTTEQASYEGARELGRLNASPVQVAVALEESGQPRAIEGGLFAFLPIAAHTGLRVLVHARFDVTLDRERLELDSPWNDALLEATGRALAAAALDAVEKDHSPLAILNPRDELSPDVASVHDALVAALGEESCLPTHHGFVAPRNAVVLPAALQRSLEQLVLGEHTPLSALSERERRVARDLGAQPFGQLELLRWASSQLVAGERPPTWLDGPVLQMLASAGLEALQDLPLCVAGSQLCTPRRAHIASPALASLYDGIDSVISSTWLEAHPALAAALALPRFDLEQLVTDLGGVPAAALVQETRGSVLRHALSELDDAQLHRLDRIPLLRNEHGERCHAHELHTRPSWLDPETRAAFEALTGSLADTLVAHEDALTRRWLAPLSFAHVVSRLESHLESTSVSSADAHACLPVLNRLASHLDRQSATRLAALPLFADRQGELRPLLGAGSAWTTRDNALQEQLPSAPWAINGPFLASVAAYDTTRDRVALILASTVPSWTEEGLHSLATTPAALNEDAKRALETAALWKAMGGARRLSKQLRRGNPTSAAIAAAYSAGPRELAAPDTLALYDTLGLPTLSDAGLPSDDRIALIDDLASGRLDLRESSVQRALPELLKLPVAALGPLRSRAWLLDSAGQPRAAANWPAEEDERLRRAGSFRSLLEAHIPLVRPQDEAELGELLDALGFEPAEMSDVLALGDSLEPHTLIDTLRTCETLSEADRLAVESLAIFDDRTGTPRRCVDLADGAIFDAEGEDDDTWRVELGSSLLTVAHASLCQRLGLQTRSPASVLIEGPLLKRPLVERTVADSSLERDHLHRLARLCVAAGLDPLDHALALDITGSPASGPLLHGPEPDRALAANTALGLRLADSDWATHAHSTLVEAIENTPLAIALKEAFPHASPRDKAQEGALLRWLARERTRLEAPALDALKHAAIFPSERGPRVRITSLALDPGMPDLGIAWGLAPSVPEELKAWLSHTFAPDRHTRRELVSLVLDALDETAEHDDVERASALLKFIGRTLGAENPQIPDAQLDADLRRLDVRKRVRVPTDSGDWHKPRFAWLPERVGAARFASGLPPVIALGHHDVGLWRLLRALGAQTHLGQSQIESLLEQLGGAEPEGALRLREGSGARHAFAAHLLRNASEDPASVDRYRLRTTAFLPDAHDVLRKPSELVWPEGLDVLSDTPRPHDAVLESVRTALDADEVRALRGRLGLRAAHELPASAYGDRNGRSDPLPLPLLDFVESQLDTSRWSAAEVRDAFSDIWILDTAGVPRRSIDLAQAGANDLFGDWRGEFSSHPKTATALGIPRRPDRAMIERFLVEIGQGLEDLSEDEAHDLVRRVPRCWATLDGAASELPADAVVAAQGADTVLVRRDDSRLSIAEPPELAHQLPLDAVLDPLPSRTRAATLRDALLASGMPDLHTKVRIESVDAGPDVADQGPGRVLHASLAPLGERAGTRVRLVSSLLIHGVIGVHSVSTSAPAALHEGTLWLTEDALEDPRRLAPVLAPAPESREAMHRWLGERHTGAPANQTKPRKKKPKRTRAAPVRPAPKRSLWQTFMARFSDESPAPASASVMKGRGAFDPQDVIRPQLDEIDDFSAERLRVPEFGFAFEPKRLPEPWIYAPHVVAADFRRGVQSWATSKLARPAVRGESRRVRMRGRLPRGRSVLPVPHYARVSQIRSSDADVEVMDGRHGEVQVDLTRASELQLELVCGSLPSLVDAQSSARPEHSVFTVPDGELPDEVHDFLADLRAESPSPARVISEVQDFIRRRYRYDPSYLEDPAVGRWLLRVTRGRESQAMATLHAAADGRHLGAGVCFEFGHLSCELLRRAGLAAGVASGWVLEGGQVSAPDHLWAVAFLLDPHGRPIWVPVDSATTEEGRPLRVPQRARGDFRAPKPPPPSTSRDARSAGWFRNAAEKAARPKKKPKKVRVPRQQWFEVVRWLEAKAGRRLAPEERRELLEILDDPKRRSELLEWLSPRS